MASFFYNRMSGIGGSADVEVPSVCLLNWHACARMLARLILLFKFAWLICCIFAVLRSTALFWHSEKQLLTTLLCCCRNKIARQAVELCRAPSAIARCPSSQTLSDVRCQMSDVSNCCACVSDIRCHVVISSRFCRNISYEIIPISNIKYLLGRTWNWNQMSDCVMIQLS